MDSFNQLVVEEDGLRPSIGHNSGAPMALAVIDPDILDADILTHRTRAEELLATYGKVLIVDQATAEGATQLSIQIRDLAEKLDTQRKEQKAPYAEQIDLIDTKFGAVIKPLNAAYTSIRGMLNVFIRRQEADAAADRARAAAEQRQREAEARRAQEEADRIAAENAQSGEAARLRALQAKEEAERAAARAEAIRPEPIRTIAGNVNQARERQFEITDVNALVRGLLKTDRPALIEVLDAIVKRKLSTLSFSVIEKHPADQPIPGLPGIRAWVGARAQIRGRR